MIFNFLSQIVLLILFLFVVHGCWAYIQDNVLKKKTEIVTPNQIQKYEKMIEDLQSQQQQQSPSSSQSSDKSFVENNTDMMEEDLGNYVDSLL
jgi:hypothetical protein